jgi:periplasmic nitrate reductase NapE
MPTMSPDRSPDIRAGAEHELYGVTDASQRRRELVTFLILAVVIWPILAVVVVGGYGFLVWMSQLIFGPPGPPT